MRVDCIFCNKGQTSINNFKCPKYGTFMQHNNVFSCIHIGRLVNLGRKKGKKKVQGVPQS